MLQFAQSVNARAARVRCVRARRAAAWRRPSAVAANCSAYLLRLKRGNARNHQTSAGIAAKLGLQEGCAADMALRAYSSRGGCERGDSAAAAADAVQHGVRRRPNVYLPIVVIGMLFAHALVAHAGGSATPAAQ
ncbi:hypothetical protein [Xanthomonas translucens]|uniref:Uncharacterized protein n=1 Tax=Xanthomonas translucens pv. translucens TaxID=134875 RepID=A0ABW9L261_XANCT|nr:hypothetical protein [Xanthomonas translucens]MCT8278163.1 hypothetical protein [Xanthomonas translucens pv. translucens]MCT8289313.1 hypothetical protein [Xanthomonas translucens pv. translucens]MCT8293035.1 hypothetical protein [Xanthomonas translucens pv. translucens]MCT8307500.1 hypothetical protein [Xanthomonas translucens pv. translucens]MCT8313101.1 hypothetical protein [Xanthomonas translucens pv. translucens]